MQTTISAKGQITVPQAVRKALGLKPGTKLNVRLHRRGGFMVNKAADENFFGRFRGVRRKNAKWLSGDDAVQGLRGAPGEGDVS